MVISFRRLGKFVAVALLAAGAFMTIAYVTAAPFPKVTAPISEFAEEVFIDYAAPSHAGPGPHPTAESSDFKLTQGGIKWPNGATVKYAVLTAGCSNDCADAVNQIDLSFNAWELGVLTFTRDDGSPDTNPCTGSANSVSFSTVDGASGVLAFASVCRNVATKEIVGFRIVYDSAETWSDSGDAGKFDIRNVGTHEAGHVGGLGHDNPARSGCLTMYKFSGLAETQKRTLGLGDKLGMDTLYSTGDTSAGPGCGL